MNSKYLGLTPILILLASLLIVTLTFYPEQNLPRSLLFDIPSPFSSAHSWFLSVTALVVAYFFARSFLSGGSFNSIALGNASLVLGLGFLLSQILGSPPFGGPNQLTGISSLVFLFSGIFYGVFATLSLLGKFPHIGKPLVTLVVTYIASIGLIFVIISLVETGSLPYFFVKGPTLLRAEVLGAAVVLYSYSSLVVMRNYSLSHDSILYWFSLGLAAIAVGFVSALLGRVPGGPFSWLARIAVSVGGLYLIVAILVAYRGAEKPG